MNAINKKLAINVNKVVAVMIAITIGLTVMPGFVPKAYSHDHHHHHHHHHWHHGYYDGYDDDAFLGGMVTEHVLDSQAAPAPAPAAKPTDQQRLDQLNKLGAGGYITPQEYKTKKKSILDGM